MLLPMGWRYRERNVNKMTQIVDVTSEVIRDYLENISEPNMSPTAAYRHDTRPHLHRASDGSSRVLNPEPVRASSATIPISLPQRQQDRLLSPKHSDSVFEDGIFLPGSQYQELHAALRSRIIDTARSTVPSRLPSPTAELPLPSNDRQQFDVPLGQSMLQEIVDNEDDESRMLADLSSEQEHALWLNYIYEVASWLDKFDKHRHFELVLPYLTKAHPHLRFAMLALSARQMERKMQTADSSVSLSLYQRAIHLLSPLLHKRTSIVLASCIVLCVLEMLSCSPKAWRRHFDGCAALIQALGISGSHGSALIVPFFGPSLEWTYAARSSVARGP